MTAEQDGRACGWTAEMDRKAEELRVDSAGYFQRLRHHFVGWGTRCRDCGLKRTEHR